MNKEAQTVLATIVAKDIHELTESDIAFLKARRSYLSKDQKAKYAKVLATETENNKELTDAASEGLPVPEPETRFDNAKPKVKKSK